MPPKRGRGRGRGGPSDRREQPPPVTSERPGRDPRIPHEEAARHHPPPGVRAVQPEELGFEFKQKLALTTELPRSPGEGQLGRRIRLVSNCFPIQIPSGSIYHYDVDIVNKRNVSEAGTGAAAPLSGDKKYRCLSTKRNRQIVNLMLNVNENFKGLFAAYDGRKNLYTRRPLDMRNVPLKCEVVIEDEVPGNPDDPRGPRGDTFVVYIQPVRKRDTNSCAISLDPLHALFAGKVTSVPQEAIMALETVLRHGPCLRYTPVGRSFFYPPDPDDMHPLGGGKEIWFGYHQSLRLGQWRPMVNVDITATTFYEKGPVLKYIADLMRTSVDGLRQIPGLRDSDIKRISKELKTMQIEVNHLRNYRRKYRILRLTRESAGRLTFSLNVDGRATTMTVADYFQRHHHRRLQFAHLPCLQVNPETKKVYLPIEVCDMVEGQHCKKKLDDKQGADMIKFTARPPQARFNEIRDIIRRADYDHDDHLREFGMRVYCEPLKLEGRVLEAPNVQYTSTRNNDPVRIKPRDGSWDMREKRFFRPAEIESWVLLSFANPRFCSNDALNDFARLLCRIAQETGIIMRRPALIDIKNPRSVRVEDTLMNMKKKFNADLAVVVVPAGDKTIYGDVKQAAETMIGLCTQCIKDENVRKCKPALVSNLCQKINAKMGGINNALTPGEKPVIMSKPVIIIGADVTHPGPSQDIKPSLAAAVGSLDSHPSRYAVTCRAQTNVDENKQAIEIILDLKGMIVDLLKAFYRNTRLKPEKIIFYRDGVSEGQFEKVRDHEVRCIREACRSLGEHYQPGITFIVVQKRHHTRFMPEDSREGVGKMRNMPPGTAVDTTVTHPLNFDFFLCSHFGLQGTSRPSHYTVIEDDNDFTADDLQKLTYYLCHTYVRCTKSISTPAPVQYAHLAAYRARQHLVSQIEEATTSSDTSSPGTFHPLPESVINAIKVVDGLKDAMYYV